MRYVLCICSTAIAALSATAQTSISRPNIFERSQSEMLSDAFGQPFQQIGADLIGSSISALRVSDTQDQIWNAGTYSVEIFGRESLFNKKFGYATNDDSFERILRTTSGPNETTITISDDFAWAVKNASLFGGNVYTSDDELNRDGMDHMITYRLLEGDRTTGYALFFEDWGGHLSDRDFNDLGVLISLVPVPQSAALAAVGLGLLASGTGRRR